MNEITLATPALLFSAISLIMLAYTNRFLAYATLVRSLHAQYLEQKDKVLLWQIKNLRKRLSLTRGMQVLGIASLLLCVGTMFFIYVGYALFAQVIFAIALVLLIGSLILLIWEIRISTKALDLQLGDMEDVGK
jgi:Flp pilus assembly protein TadB